MTIYTLKGTAVLVGNETCNSSRWLREVISLSIYKQFIYGPNFYIISVPSDSYILSKNTFPEINSPIVENQNEEFEELFMLAEFH